MGVRRLSIDSELDELGKFFENYQLNISASDPIFGSEWYRIWVRRLLAFQIIVFAYPHRIAASQKLLKESFSDLIGAFAMSHLGYYKSADHLLRSSSEMMLRAILVNKGLAKEVAKLRDTPALFKLFRKSVGPSVSSDVDAIASTYAKLSESVHTSTSSHMTLVDALERGPKRTPTAMRSRSDLSTRLLRAYMALFYAEYAELSELLAIRPHALQDFFLDNVRPTLKRERHKVS